MSDRNTREKLSATFDMEEGHAYAWGGRSIVLVVLLILLIIWLL